MKIWIALLTAVSGLAAMYEPIGEDWEMRWEQPMRSGYAPATGWTVLVCTAATNSVLLKRHIFLTRNIKSQVIFGTLPSAPYNVWLQATNAMIGTKSRWVGPIRKHWNPAVADPQLLPDLAPVTNNVPAGVVVPQQPRRSLIEPVPLLPPAPEDLPPGVSGFPGSLPDGSQRPL